MHMPNDGYYHDHGDGIVHCHDHAPTEDMSQHEAHEHIHPHHPHKHENSKAVANRLARAIGHLESVKRMVEDGRDCSEVLIQLAAVRSALNSTAKVILKDHLEHCITDAMETGDTETISNLNDAIDRYID